MLSSRARLKERQGLYGTPRHEYLQELVSEFQYTQYPLRKEEILANLANFAYDPINYGSFSRLNILELFIDILDECLSKEKDKEKRESSHKNLEESFVEFALGGISNCIPDPIFQQRFMEYDALTLVTSFLSIEISSTLSPSRINSIISAMSICYFLLDSIAFLQVTDISIRRQMECLQQQQVSLPIANTANAFFLRFNELMENCADEVDHSE
jgi:hypothetical protein